MSRLLPLPTLFAPCGLRSLWDVKEGRGGTWDDEHMTMHLFSKYHLHSFVPLELLILPVNCL